MKTQASFLLSRRKFLKNSIIASCIPGFSLFANEETIQTVTGPISVSKLGRMLIHEHVLVDFIGADKISPERWDRDVVIKKVLPFLLEIKSRGIRSIAECTPAFIGRDVKLLQMLSGESGVQILTNTGYYGASDNKYLPKWAFTESAEQLSERWIFEFQNGIDGTSIRPAFIKTAVNPGKLSELHQKLIKAAALTHLKTGLTICSHTGPALPAFEELNILKENGVHPSAFVWVHANGSEDDFLKLGKMGCWISLDGISDHSLEKNVKTVLLLKANHLLQKLLISHDAGWYSPGEPDGGKFRGFTTISDSFLPLLKKQGVTDQEIDQIMVKNPAKVFMTKIRTI